MTLLYVIRFGDIAENNKPLYVQIAAICYNTDEPIDHVDSYSIYAVTMLPSESIKIGIDTLSELKDLYPEGLYHKVEEHFKIAQKITLSAKIERIRKWKLYTAVEMREKFISIL